MILTNIVVGLVQLVITIIFAVLSLYISLIVYSKMARTMDAEEELLRGNFAVAIVIAAVFVAIAVVIESGVTGLALEIYKVFEAGINPGDAILIGGIALLQLILGVVLAVGSIFLALKVLEKLASGIAVFEELKKGNVAVALEMAGVIIAVAVIVQSGVLGITSHLA